MEQKRDDRLEEEDFGAILRTLGPQDLLRPARTACSLPCQRAEALFSAAANQAMAQLRRNAASPSHQRANPFGLLASRQSNGVRCPNPQTAPTPYHTNALSRPGYSVHCCLLRLRVQHAASGWSNVMPERALSYNATAQRPVNTSPFVLISASPNLGATRR